jgi:hypothetical protein
MTRITTVASRSLNQTGIAKEGPAGSGPRVDFFGDYLCRSCQSRSLSSTQ